MLLFYVWIFTGTVMHYSKLVFYICLSGSYVAFCTDSVKLGDNFLAGKDIPIGVDKQWASATRNSSSLSIVHALIFDRKCVFIEPTELTQASHLVRKNIGGKSHLTDLIIDQNYLNALSQVIKDPERTGQLSSWKKINAAPILTALILPANVNFSQLPVVTTMEHLKHLKVSWLIPKPIEDLPK